MFMVLTFMFNNTYTYTHINADQNWQWGEQVANISTIFLDHESKKVLQKDRPVSAGS